MAGEKVLIVEDESVVALDIEDALTASGYTVVGTESWGEKALAKAISLQPDIVLMDIRLKGQVDGIQACESIKKELNLPVIFLTAHADEATLQRAKVVAPDGYVLKPFEPQELRAAIELALFRRAQLPKTSGVVNEPLVGEVDWGALAVSSVEDRVSLFQKLMLFDALSPATLQTLAQNSSTRQLDSGAVLWEEGSRINRAFVVLAGRAAFIKTSSSGKEMIVELLAPGDILPILFSLGVNGDLNHANAPLLARLQSPGQVLEIPLSALAVIRNDEPQLFQRASRILLDRLSASYERTRALAHDAVESRICAAFRTLAPQFAKAHRGDSYAIYITRQELADLTGTTTETAIRVTKNLERAGILDLTRPGIIRILDEKTLPE